MFLVGGAPFSGKTLLALMLNQADVVCLDEPDFHKTAQRHRGIPVLARLFPDRELPRLPDGDLAYSQAVDFIRDCEIAIHPFNLGMKTAGWTFIEYARIYRASRYPTIAVIRDIRDVLAEGALPEWVGGERGLNTVYRLIWENLDLVDLCVRYEDLVTETDDVIDKIARLIGRDVKALSTWPPEHVHPTMFKLDRHEMLRTGHVAQTQAGIWKSSGVTFSNDTRMTARMMGYGAE